MKRIIPFLLILAFLYVKSVSCQNAAIPKPADKKVQAISYKNDTVVHTGDDYINQIRITETATEFSITSYKNVDYLKADPQLLESAGLHPDIYISNTHQGVIIISSLESNEVLKDFSHTLELNPAYYESFKRQDTIIFSNENIKFPEFDFMHASSINHDYKNAFNYAVDPRTGISWSKGTHKDLLQSDILGKVVYDLIIVRPKK